MSITGRDAFPTPDDAGGGALAGLGVGRAEERVYRTLLRHGPATIAQLVSRHADLSASQVRRLIPRLGELGLVSRLPGQPVRLVPARPDAAVEALASRRMEELNRSRMAATALLEEASFGADSRPQELLEIVTGREAVAQRFVHLHDIAQDELRVLILPPYALDPGEPHPQESVALDRGVRIRGIYDPQALQLPALLADVARNTALGEEARIGDVPLKLVVADRRSAMLPLTSGPGVVDNALVIHASALLDALVSLFEVLWRAAVPFPTSNGQVPGGADVRENQVLALLAAGVTDESIARQLGVSARTVQRHIRAICDDLGAVTRFQAGLKVGRSRRTVPPTP